MQSKLDSFISFVKSSLTPFALTLSTRSNGIKMVILVDDKYFKMKFLRHCIS